MRSKLQPIILLLSSFLILFVLCDGGRRRQRGQRPGREDFTQRRRRPHVRSRDPRFSFTDATTDWFQSILAEHSSFASSTDEGSFQWAINSGPLFTLSSSGVLQSGNSQQNSGENGRSENNVNAISTQPPTRDSPSTARPEILNVPWRGKGSFTGDLRLDCSNKKCSRGAVQVFNREEKTWGNICGDRWTKKESKVVCNFLKFSNGARKALRLRSKKLSPSSRTLPTAYRGMKCTGRETSIIQCLGEAVDASKPCQSDRFAGVICSGKIVSTSDVAQCSATQVQCRNREKCIETNFVCDGMSDCPWGTDEENCEGNTGSCPANHFWCGTNGSGCIRNSYRCDGDHDCFNGNDEDGCEDHLSHFRKTDNRKMRFSTSYSESGWRNLSPYLCAKKCREETDFQCIAFDYDKAARECDLASVGQRDRGVTLARSNGWDHYEMFVPTDCNGFLCGDICLSSSQLCDGRANCMDASDERNCETDATTEPAILLRLSGGITSSDGRVEIKRGNGAYGLICDIGWTINEANVACRQLGFRNGAIMTVPGLTFHRTNLNVRMSGVSCNGNEASLIECSHDPWDAVSCPRDHEAGVLCRKDDGNVPLSSRPTRPRQPTTTPILTTTTSTTTRRTTQSASSATCGVKPTTERSLVRPKIVGGNNAQPHEWPWQVGIWLPWQLMCGGTLIGECWVLTAAHCFVRSFAIKHYTVRLGDHRTKVQEGTEQDFAIERLISHSYDTATHNNDIALLQLKRKNGRCARLTDEVQLACLPSSTSQFVAGKQCHIVGWGQTQSNSDVAFTSYLKEAVVPLLSKSECISRTEYGSELSRNMFCAGYLAGGIDTCQGDSGGPLLCKSDVDGRYYLWGIVSWGNGCARPRAPGIYTLVANYLDWIEQNSGVRL